MPIIIQPACTFGIVVWEKHGKTHSRSPKRKRAKRETTAWKSENRFNTRQTSWARLRERWGAPMSCKNWNRIRSCTARSPKRRAILRCGKHERCLHWRILQYGTRNLRMLHEQPEVHHEGQKKERCLHRSNLENSVKNRHQFCEIEYWIFNRNVTILSGKLLFLAEIEMKFCRNFANVL